MRVQLILLSLVLMTSLPVFAEPLEPGQSLGDVFVSAPACEASAGTLPGTLAQRGCCSWHGGVCGCYGSRVVCCDGRLSPSCTCKDGLPEPGPLASNAE